MSIEGGAAAMDDASYDASSMAFSPPASIAPIRIHSEGATRQVMIAHVFQYPAAVSDKIPDCIC